MHCAVQCIQISHVYSGFNRVYEEPKNEKGGKLLLIHAIRIAKLESEIIFSLPANIIIPSLLLNNINSCTPLSAADNRQAA